MRSGWLCLLLAACGAVPRNEFEQGFTVPPLDASERAVMRDLLTGIDPIRTDATWTVGDTVLYGVRTHSDESSELLGLRFTLKRTRVGGEGELGARQIQSATLHDGGSSSTHTSELAEVAAFVRESDLDAKGLPGQRGLGDLEWQEEDGVSVVLKPDPSELSILVPREFLSVSIPAGVRLAESLRSPPGGTSEAIAAATPEFQRVGLAIYSFFEIGRQKPELWRIIRKVSDEPSWLSVLTRLGVSVTMRIDIQAGQLLDRIPGFELPLPGCRVPIVVLANDQPALYLSLYAIEPQPPFHLCAGIVAVEAHRPSDPKTTLRIDLIAARLGALNAGR